MANTLPSNVVPGEVDLLYPDLMSKDGLLYILRQRYIDQQHIDMESLSKEALIDLYNQYILPLPQRNYRSNRRGKEMCKKQAIISKKRHLEYKDDMNQSTKKKQMFTGPHGDRLKPPPSSATYGNAILKLGNSRNEYKLPESELKDKHNMSCNSQSQDNNTRKRAFNKDDSHSDQITHSPVKKSINKISWP